MTPEFWLMGIFAVISAFMLIQAFCVWFIIRPLALNLPVEGI